MWTLFWDMHSGGGQKEKWAQIYIEAPEEEAKIIFYNRFDHNPERVTCTCCGDDYSISEDKSFAEISKYHRSKPFGTETPMTVECYQKNEDILVIFAKDIKAKERIGTVPQQGYVWQE